MAQFKVEVEVKETHFVDVEANDEDEAKRIAHQAVTEPTEELHSHCIHFCAYRYKVTERS